MTTVNKTAALIVFGVLAGLGIIGTVLLLHFRPDATATLTTFVLTVLALVSTFAGNLYVNTKTTAKVEEVRAQTNGTLSKRDEEIARLTRELVEANRKLHPEADERQAGRHSAQ